MTIRSDPRAGSLFFGSPFLSSVLFEHDLFGKPASAPDQVRDRLFPDHALAAAFIHTLVTITHHSILHGGDAWGTGSGLSNDQPLARWACTWAFTWPWAWAWARHWPSCRRPARGSGRRPVPRSAGTHSRPAGSRAAASCGRTAAPSAAAAVQPGLCAPRRPNGRAQSRRRRPGPRRANQALRRCRRQAASRSRPPRDARQTARLRERIFLALHRPGAGMPAAQRADPAAARQPRSHDERSRAAQERQQLRSGRPAAGVAQRTRAE